MTLDKYIFKDLSIAASFIAVILAVIILLTQSLRFLELVINAGASAFVFWALTVLAMPRFFEIILPIALMAAVLFVYNRMTMDSELIAMRASGASPLRLARPAIVLSVIVTGLMLTLTLWLTPISLSNMEYTRTLIKAQYSTLLFREGVFNPVGDGLTVYIREHAANGELRGVMIYDSRKQDAPPVTILARRGVLSASRKGQDIVVFEGSRQTLNPRTGMLSRLDFDQYTIDIPEGSGPVRQRWREPEERTFMELLRPTQEDIASAASADDFKIELHRRLISPLLAPAFALLALVCLLVGPVDRRGQGRRIAAAVLCAVLIEGLYLGTYNIVRHNIAGLAALYVLVILPSVLSVFLLSERSETVRLHWQAMLRRKRVFP